MRKLSGLLVLGLVMFLVMGQIKIPVHSAAVFIDQQKIVIKIMEYMPECEKELTAMDGHEKSMEKIRKLLALPMDQPGGFFENYWPTVVMISSGICLNQDLVDANKGPGMRTQREVFENRAKDWKEFAKYLQGGMVDFLFYEAAWWKLHPASQNRGRACYASIFRN